VSAARVTLLGLGPMGQAMARSLLATGHRVTVWNRTSSRAESVVADGAHLATSPAEAVAASELIMLSLTDYQVMWDVLGAATASLAGRTLANLSSDTPDKTRQAATWAHSHGASFLAGGVMVPAAMVGTDAAYVYYSGDMAAFEAHRATLARIGEPRFLGDDPARAQLMYQAHLDVFLTALSGLAHAIALVGSASITAESFLPAVMHMFRAIPEMIAPDGVEALGARIDAGEHLGEASNNTMLGATADHIQAASQSVGIDTTLPRVVQEYYRRAIADGHGADGWTRIIDSIRNP
jgi:3-hydroxyisobutyrate dehydrogenase-like beta-hydroxyacid dehydrogenase